MNLVVHILTGIHKTLLSDTLPWLFTRSFSKMRLLKNSFYNKCSNCTSNCKLLLQVICKKKKKSKLTFTSNFLAC